MVHLVDATVPVSGGCNNAPVKDEAYIFLFLYLEV